MNRIIVTEENGVCVPKKITSIFRKVSAQERLPKEFGRNYFTNIGNTYFPKKIDGLYEIHPDNVIWWLEEVELPTQEQMKVEAEMYAENENSCYTNDYNGHMKGQKVMLDFVLAVAPLTACR